MSRKYLLLYSLWLASSMPVVEHCIGDRETAQDVLGDLTGTLDINEDYIPQANCKQFYDFGLRTSGLYKINTNDGKGEFTAFCDMSLQSGGWTIILRRVNGALSFNLNKTHYQVGFGKFSSNFWLGLEKIKRLTDFDGATYKLYIGLESFLPRFVQFHWAEYGSFGLGGAVDDYKLSIGDFDTSGPGSDALYPHNEMKFSTPDNDVDTYRGLNCADLFKSGWWFNNCHHANLNGIYYNDGFHNTSLYDGLTWSTWLGDSISLKTVVMAIQPA